ncbi:MAG: protein-export chaperone SecB [Gemmatimonadaceae bacterium]
MSPANTESGYILESLTFPVQVLVAAVPDPTAENAEWGWDWQWKDRDHFEVGLLFVGPPLDARPEKVQVSVNAVFRVVGDVQTVPIEQFAHGHAPALIFPYIRQVVDELTSRSPYGRVLLPPTNIVALMASFDAAEASGSRSPRPASV